MRLARREVVAVARCPFVRREIDLDAAPLQCIGERLGGKQMAAGSPRREQNERHQAVRNSGGRRSSDTIAARGRSRVSASSMPMP